MAACQLSAVAVRRADDIVILHLWFRSVLMLAETWMFHVCLITVACSIPMRTHMVAVGEVWVSSLPEGQEVHDGSSAPLRQAALVP